MLSNKPLLNLSAERIIIIADLQKGWGPADLYWAWLQVGVVLGLWWQQLGQLYFFLQVCGSTEATAWSVLPPCQAVFSYGNSRGAGGRAKIHKAP